LSSQSRIAALIDTLAAQPAHERPRDHARTLARLAMEYAYAGLPLDGLVAVKEALSLAHAHNLAFERAEALASAAMCHHMRVDHMMSIACGFDAYQGFAALNEYGRMGHQLITLAAACRDLQAHDLAEKAVRGCLTIAERINDKLLEARSHNVLGLTFTDCQRFDEAEREFILSRDCLIARGELIHVPKVTANIGVLFRRRADVANIAGDKALSESLLKQAIEHLREGLQAALSDDNKFEIADKTGSIGQYYFLLNDFATARILVTQSLEMGFELKHARLMVDGHLWLGQIELGARQYLLAETHLRAAIDRARQAGLRSLQQAGHEQLSSCYLTMERPDDAAAQAVLSADLRASSSHDNLEAQRELRMMWHEYLSHHPMMRTNDADAHIAGSIETQGFG
jgi:tetratricopeptide (TPR) repeat protein